MPSHPVSRREFLALTSAAGISFASGALVASSCASKKPSVSLGPAAEIQQEDILEFGWDFIPRPDYWFMVISDTHITPQPEPWITKDLFVPAGARESWQQGAAMNIGRLLKIIDQANASKPSFVMHLGDITTSHPQRHGWDKECLNGQKLMAMFKMPVHLCPGNHDTGNKLSLPLPNWPASAGDPKASFHVSPDNLALYQRYFGDPYYSFNHGPDHFIVLCEHMFGSGWKLEEEEWKWLEADLEAGKRARHIFMFFHTPMYWVDPITDAGPGNYEVIDEGPRGRLLGLVRKYNVRAVFTGHTHHNITNQYEDCALLTVTSTAFARNSWSLYPDIGGGNRDPAHAGYLVVRVYGDAVAANFVRTVDRLPAARPPGGASSLPARLLTVRCNDSIRLFSASAESAAAEEELAAPLAVSAPLPYKVPPMWGPANVIDGRITGPDGRDAAYAGWASAATPLEDAGQWIQVEFEKPAVISKIVLVPRPNAFPVDFQVDLRSNGSWKELRRETAFAEPRAGERVEFDVPGIAADAVRVAGTRLRPDKPGGQRGYMSFLEIEAYDSRGANVALASRGGRATASSQSGRPGNYSNDNAWAAAFDTGAGMVRVSAADAGWESIEPHEGRYVFPDHKMYALNVRPAQRVPVIFPLTTSNSLYDGSSIDVAFSAYVRAVVEATASRVAGWELNLSASSVKLQPSKVLDYLAVLEKAARSRSKGSIIVLQGISCADTALFERAVAVVPPPLHFVIRECSSYKALARVVGLCGRSSRVLVELQAAAPIFEPDSAIKAARDFAEVLSAGAIPSFAISGDGGLTDEHDDPGAAYYAVRALSTALAGTTPAPKLVGVEWSRRSPNVRHLARSNSKGDCVLLFWRQEPSDLASEPAPADVTLAASYRKAVAVDPIESTLYPCALERRRRSTDIRDLGLRPYPLVLRLWS